MFTPTDFCTFSVKQTGGRSEEPQTAASPSPLPAPPGVLTPGVLTPVPVQLPLLGQQQHVHVAVLLQGGGEDGALAAEQEDQRQADVVGGVSVPHHLKEGGLLAVAALMVVWEGEVGLLTAVVLRQLAPPPQERPHL